MSFKGWMDGKYSTNANWLLIVFESLITPHSKVQNITHLSENRNLYQPNATIKTVSKRNFTNLLILFNLSTTLSGKFDTVYDTAKLFYAK